MISIEVDAALRLMPELKALYALGVISVSGMTGEVHMTPDAFHKAFPEITERHERDSAEFPYIWETKCGGVTFFALEAV